MKLNRYKKSTAILGAGTIALGIVTSLYFKVALPVSTPFENAKPSALPISVKRIVERGKAKLGSKKKAIAVSTASTIDLDYTDAIAIGGDTLIGNPFEYDLQFAKEAAMLLKVQERSNHSVRTSSLSYIDQSEPPGQKVVGSSTVNLNISGHREPLPEVDSTIVVTMVSDKTKTESLTRRDKSFSEKLENNERRSELRDLRQRLSNN